ncbi:MAG: hypothetical protein ACYCV0_20200 [Desulfitobacteriaceae bacterium]
MEFIMLVGKVFGVLTLIAAIEILPAYLGTKGRKIRKTSKSTIRTEKIKTSDMSKASEAERVTKEVRTSKYGKIS